MRFRRRRAAEQQQSQQEDEGAPKPEGTEEGQSETPIGVFGTVRAAGRALAPLGRRRLMIAVAAMGGVGLGVIILFSGFSFWWTSQPQFCNRCHVMEKYVTAWKASPHKSVNCESCHTPTGTFGFLGGKISGLQVVLNYVRGRYDDASFNAAVPNGNCLECHKSILDSNVHKDGLVVSHKNIVAAGGKCMSCHSAIAHGDAIPVGSHTEPTMAACLKCHNDKIAPLKCSLCHPGRADVPATAANLEQTQRSSSP